MRIVITCGPAIAPIDEVRRITNFSTGELGILLANAFAQAGHEVVCLKGEASTSPLPFAAGVRSASFTTNDDLAQKLQSLAPSHSYGGTASGLSDFSNSDPIDLILHTAALCDYEVAEVRDETGQLQQDAKIPSRTGGLILHLKPARKILPCLRDWFPQARIVGWKYELNGGPVEARAAGHRQLTEARTNLCILNGVACGPGFGLLHPDNHLGLAADKPALCAALLHWSTASRPAREINQP